MKYQIPKMYFQYKTKSGRTIYRKNLTTRRIGAVLGSNKFEKGVLKVEYGKAKCANGCVCVLDNEIKGNAEDIKWGLIAFLDKDLYEN